MITALFALHDWALRHFAGLAISYFSIISVLAVFAENPEEFLLLWSMMPVLLPFLIALAVLPFMLLAALFVPRRRG